MRVLYNQCLYFLIYYERRDIVDKIYATQFLREVAKKSGVKYKITKDVYDAMIEVLLTNLENDVYVQLRNFGSFYTHIHKGHPIQFNEKKKAISDYRVVKFSPAIKTKQRFKDKK